MTVRNVTWLSDEMRANFKGSAKYRHAGGALPLLLGKQCEKCGWLDIATDTECFRCGAMYEPMDMGGTTVHAEETINDNQKDRTVTVPVRQQPASRESERRHSPIHGPLWCLPAIDVEPFPYQVEAALMALDRLEGRALLADEVGLGKTVEAGLCIKELIMRGYGSRVLVLVPASLTVQWAEELATKFNETFTIVKSIKDWKGNRLIVSHDLFRRPNHAAQALALSFDVLVVDEAHKLKNPRTLLHATVAALSATHVFFLTATPIQNNLLELYHLVSLLRPGHLGPLSMFRREFIAKDNPREAKNIRALRTLMDGVMVRHHRDEVGVLFPARRAAIYEVALEKAERVLYEEVTSYIYSVLDTDEGISRLLTLMLLQKELCSSPAAIASTLMTMHKQSESLNGVPRLKELAAMAKEIGPSTKIRLALDIVRREERKVLLFTDYRATMEEAYRLFDEAGIETVCFHGGLSEQQKEGIVARFRGKARVMISTESGSEGRNLQFCSTVINLDLPWNPMRLEQRIGRVHRLGQTREVVVYNLIVADTIEDYIMDVLATKIRLFELVVGELDIILGGIDRQKGFEELIARIWRTSRTKEELDQAFAELGEKAAASRQEYERFRKNDLMRG